MGTVFNKRSFWSSCRIFTALRAALRRFFDSYGIEVLAYPPELPAYCRLIRSVPDGKTGCYLCDQAALPQGNAAKADDHLPLPCGVDRSDHAGPD